jgi:hypothetical protein
VTPIYTTCDPGVQLFAAKTSRIHTLCVLPDWNPPHHHSASSKHYFSQCTSLVEHSRPRLHAAFLQVLRWLGYLLAQVVFFIIQFMLIHVAIRSTPFYHFILPLDSWGRTRVVYNYWGHQTLPNFRAGAARTRLGFTYIAQATSLSSQLFVQAKAP